MPHIIIRQAPIRGSLFQVNVKDRHGSSGHFTLLRKSSFNASVLLLFIIAAIYEKCVYYLDYVQCKFK